MSITGLPGQGPVRVGIPIADLSAGIFCAMGILVALLEREVSGEGQWVESSLLAAQIAMLDFQAARWLIAQRGAGAGRQRPSDQHPDRRLPDPRRPYQHRLGRRRDLPPACAGRSTGPNSPSIPDYQTGRAALGKPQGAQRGDRGDHRDARQRRMDRPLQRGRRAGGPDLHDRRGLRRPAGQASRHRPAGRASDARADRTGRSGGDAEPHAEPAQHRQPRPRRAHRRDPARARLQRRRHRRAARRSCRTASARAGVHCSTARSACGSPRRRASTVRSKRAAARRRADCRRSRSERSSRRDRSRAAARGDQSPGRCSACAPAGERRLDAEAEKAQHRFQQDDVADASVVATISGARTLGRMCATGCAARRRRGSARRARNRGCGSPASRRAPAAPPSSSRPATASTTMRKRLIVVGLRERRRHAELVEVERRQHDQQRQQRQRDDRVGERASATRSVQPPR